ARMDVSLETNEVLIEEIQNDWLRRADWLLRHVDYRRQYDTEFQPSNTYYDIGCSTSELRLYVTKVLVPYKQIWAEAMLTATIEFIWRELGINHVYYHTFETGNKLKAVPGEPPRSIYTKLPKQFGFEVTDKAPVFISQSKFAKRTLKKIKQPTWYYLNL
ncbi:MAG: hypothetical protein MI867_09260, partial [Pseudomonadales bacterium]|nr:hypothetical protein [Pseudomonadales bacterium]